ncbi:MAG: ABC transporter family substrate-binding protein [Burkholderiaceae bacterium]|nr:ABC transporter family substrate-binding protein [Microbacteriaceae bacterium]
MTADPARPHFRARARAWIGVLALSALVLTGCTGQSRVVQGTEVTVAAAQPFSSYNGNTSYGSNPAANGDIIGATNSRFFSVDADLDLVADPSFGTATVVSADPFSVRYSLSDTATWSDGERVDAADLLLAWAANSGALNTPGFDDTPYLDADNRYDRDFPPGTVFFDGSSAGGLDHVTSTPVIGDDGRSVTLAYDRYFVDWRLAFEVGVAAHVVARHAMGIDDPEEGKAAIIAAIETADVAQLRQIADFWNSGFTLAPTPAHPDLLLGTGPYTVTEVGAVHARLQANPQYRGDHAPTYESVVVRYIADPLEAVSALADGSVDVIAPQATVDVARALAGVDGIEVTTGVDGAIEHLDLQVAQGRSGVFDDERVRRAFLLTVPREEIVAGLVAPVEADASPVDSEVFLPGAPGYDDAVRTNGSDAYDAVDIPAARALLASAGVVSPEVCVLFDPANPRRVAGYELIRASAADAGFVVSDCSSPDWRELLGLPGGYDASLYALRSTNLAIGSARAAFAPGGANNTNFLDVPAITTLLDTLDTTSEPAAQAGLLSTIDGAVWAQSAGLPLYQFPSITAVRADVAGATPSPLAPGPLWNVWQWTPTSAR